MRKTRRRRRAGPQDGGDHLRATSANAPCPQAPIITDASFTQCTMCLEPFQYRETLWRLQRGHCFHALCWDRHAQGYVDRAIPGGANEAPCAVCRGPGLIVAHFPHAGQREGYAAEVRAQHEDALANANELRRLREELQAVQAAQARVADAGPPAFFPLSFFGTCWASTARCGATRYRASGRRDS